MASHSPEADAAPWRALFFEMLRKTGNVSAAAYMPIFPALVQTGRRRCYQWRLI